jgi:hypothetical protein
MDENERGRLGKGSDFWEERRSRKHTPKWKCLRQLQGQDGEEFGSNIAFHMEAALEVGHLSSHGVEILEGLSTVLFSDSIMTLFFFASTKVPYEFLPSSGRFRLYVV